MEALYASIQSWGMREEDIIPFTYWKGVYDCRNPVSPNSLSAKFVTMSPEVAILINSHVEQTVILNEITQDNNKVPEEESNKTVKFHRLGRITEEAMSTFKSVVEAEQ